METNENSITNEDEIDLLDLIGTLIKHKWMIIIITALSMIGVVVFSVISLVLPPEDSPLPNQYTSTATILLNEDSSSGGLNSLLQASSMGGLASLAGVSSGGSSFGALAVKVAKSYSLLDILAEEFDLMTFYKINDPEPANYPITTLRSIISEKLSVTYDADETGTLAVSYTDKNPEMAMHIANRVTDLLEEKFSLVYGDQNSNEIELLSNKIQEVELETQRLEAVLQTFQKENNTIDIGLLATEQATILAELRAQLITIDLSLDTYSQFSTVMDPEHTRLQAQKENLEEMISDLENGMSETTPLPSQAELSDLALEYSHIRQDLTVQQTLYTQLVQQFELLKLTESGMSPKFMILEHGEIPEMKSGPSRGMLCMVVSAGGFFLSILLAFLREAWLNIKKDPARLDKLRLTKRKKD